MVASYDLNRYQPPLDYILSRIEQLVRLVEGGVDLDFVREESGPVLQELCAFCRSRINFAELEAKVRNAAAIDVATLDDVLGILRAAPKDRPTDRLPNRLDGLASHLNVLRADQHRLKRLEVGLRLELVFENVFQDAQMAIADGWDPQPLIDLARTKLRLLSEEQRRDLWSMVLSEFRQSDPDDEMMADYSLVDYAVLPPGFLEPTPSDLTDRLAQYYGWLRSRVVRAMVDNGRTRWPVANVGLAKVVASKSVDEAPSTTEVVVARAISNIAGWLALRHAPFSIEQFAALLGIEATSAIVGGEDQQGFASRKWQGPASAERAALHSFRTLASSVASLHENETPMGVALFQYKAGVELFAPKIAARMSQDEVELQKELSKFLLERGIFSVGTKFGQHETDLVANVRDDYIVVECKVFKKPPTGLKLVRNLMQLLRYDDLNPAFRGRRAVLVVYNFSEVPIITPRDIISGRAWIVAINAKAGPPSKTARCLQLHPDPTQGLRCSDIGSSSSPRRKSRRTGPRRAHKP